MRVVLPSEITAKLRAALVAGGSREVGGILMGEHITNSTFAVREVTVQTDGGSFATFVRAVKLILAPLDHFFRRTGNNYRRFNYLGEWHSHPAFECIPSDRDSQTMRDLVRDEQVGANFAVLVILRLNGTALVGSVSVFSRDGREESGELVIEETAHE